MSSNTKEGNYNQFLNDDQFNKCIRLPKKSDLFNDRQKYQNRLIQKIAKIGYDTMSSFQKSSKKLQNSQNATAKNLGLKLAIQDEELFKFINKNMTLEELQDIIKYLQLKTKKLSFVLKCTLHLDVIDVSQYESLLKILSKLYKIFRKFFAFLGFDNSILIDNEQKEEYGSFKDGVLFTISPLFRKTGKSDNKNLQKLQNKYGVSQADQNHLIELREQASKNSFNQFDDLVKDFQIDYNLMRNEIQNKIRKFETSVNLQQVDYKTAIRKVYEMKNQRNEQQEKDKKINKQNQDNVEDSEDELFNNDISKRKESQQIQEFQNKQILLELKSPKQNTKKRILNEMFTQESDEQEINIDEINEHMKKFQFKQIEIIKKNNLLDGNIQKDAQLGILFDFDLLQEIIQQNLKGNLHILIFSMDMNQNFGLIKKKVKKRFQENIHLNFEEPKAVSNLQLPFQYCFIIRFKMIVPKIKNKTRVKFELTNKYNKNTRQFIKNFAEYQNYYTEENYYKLLPKMSEKMRSEFYARFKDMQKLKLLDKKQKTQHFQLYF